MNRSAAPFPLDTGDFAIETVHLTKTYRSAPRRNAAPPRAAVDDLSLCVRRGDVFGFLGANGAGKTTTVKMLLGFHAASAGRAALFGVPISEPRARRRVGYLPEQPYFPRFLSAGETVRMHARLAGLNRTTAAASARACLERVGMIAHERTPLAKLSKGMTQRVALAATLVGDPDLLILDEPASGLDPLGRRDMIAVLRALAAEGKTIFLSSHFLSEVENLCRHVAILRDGKLVALGAPSEIARQNNGRALVTARDREGNAAHATLAVFGPDVESVPGDGADAEPLLRLLVPQERVYPVVSALQSARATLLIGHARARNAGSSVFPPRRER